MLRLLVQALTPTIESTVCVACGGRLDTHYQHALRTGSPVTGGEILRCTVCGTHQVSPRPSLSALAELYDSGYYEGFMAGVGMAGGNTEVSPVLRQRLAEIERRMPRGRLLDVGCGLGLFVKYAADHGWDAAGLEMSEWAAREGGKRYQVVIYRADLADAPIAPGSLDVVHFHHVMEHVLDPVATMRAARNLLRPGGLLVVEVPQELRYPLSDRVFRALHAELYQTPPPSMTHHLTFFTVSGLTSAARRAGFAIERAGTVRHVRTDESRLPLGVPAKRLLYWTEAAAQTAPDIEMWARR